MSKEMFSKILDIIDEKIDESEEEVDESSFSEIIEKKGKVVFVDGGQAELLKTADLSLQLIRVAGVVFEDNKRKEAIVDEFFVLVHFERDDLVSKIFPVKGKSISNISMNSLDASIREGNERASVSKLGGVIRRFAELNLAKRMAADAVVLDGSLKAMVKGEEDRVNELIAKGNVVGLSKTNKRLDEKGKSIAAKVASREGRWLYKIGNEDNYNVFIAKLNECSRHVFELDMAGDDISGILAANSKDPIFPGYPYGLIEADRVARVSNEEKASLLMMFKARAGKQWEKIEKRVNMQNAHDVLDNI